MNGTVPSEREGRVEICSENVYGTVCNLLFDELEAQVVCRNLGFSPNGNYPVCPCICSSCVGVGGCVGRGGYYIYVNSSHANVTMV